MGPKSNSRSDSLPSDTIDILERALVRERKARKVAERLLEDKSKELYDAMLHLKEANGRLESLLNENGKNIDGAFVNLIDPYVVMDLNTKVISMNSSAKEFLGYDNDKEEVMLSNIVHQDYVTYTVESYKKLLHIGVLKNYKAKIVTKKYGGKYVNINASLIYNKKGEPVAAQGVIRDITSEMEVQRLMESQKKQLDLIVDNSSLGILLIVKGKIVKANQSICDLLQYEEYELKKLSLEDISTIEDISQYEELLETNEEQSADSIKITRIFHQKTGGTLYGKTSIKNLYDEDGEIVYNVVMIEDVTREKLAKDKLAASESRMATMIGNLQSGVLYEDKDRHLMMTNEKFRELFSISQSLEDLKGIDCRMALRESQDIFVDPEAFISQTEAVVADQKVVVAQEFELKDGRVFSRDYIPLFEDGRPSGHLWAYNDITLQKTYRRNLEQQKKKYSNIIANMNLGLAEVDSDGSIQFANNRFSEMIGLPLEDLEGKHIRNILELDDDNQSLLDEQMASRQNGISDSYQVELPNINGEKKYWMVSGAPTYDEFGAISGSIGVLLDITQQRKLELHKEFLVKELEESNKGLQEYAHIVSHDLKSPLRSVSALTHWLYEDYKDKLDENGVYNLKMIQEKIEGMDRLIGGILKYSTLSSNSIENVDVDLDQIINEISEIIFIPENVSIKRTKKLPVIKADKTLMHQLFQNFISNAVEHIDKETGYVQVDYQDLGSHWQFSIKDNGVGIPPEYHEKIFQIFQSIGNKENSTGIGLSIVKKVIDRYKGNVWLDSEIGEGTTFYFTIAKL